MLSVLVFPQFGQYLAILDKVIAFVVRQHEYYSLDATYRGWLRCEMENSSVPPEMLSAEEKDQAIAAATQTLELAFLLLESK